MDPTDPYRSPRSNLSAPASGVDNTHPLDPSGRFTRLSWLAWNMVLGFAAFLLVAALMAAGFVALPSPEAPPSPGLGAGMGLGILVLDVAFIVLAVLLTIRRFHDMDASGWWAALLIVPLANFVVFLVLALKRGTEGANRFGPPRPTRGWEKVLGIAYIVLLALGVVGAILAIAIPAFMGVPQQPPLQ